MLNTKLETTVPKIVLSTKDHAEHEIRNYSSQNRAEHEIRQNDAEHEIRNYSSQSHAELKSGFQFNHAAIINEVLNLINL